MNTTALMALQWLRMAKPNSFDMGYACGYVNAKKYEFSAWERQYIEVVLNRILDGERA